MSIRLFSQSCVFSFFASFFLQIGIGMFLLSSPGFAQTNDTTVENLLYALEKEKHIPKKIEILNKLHSQTHPNNPRQSLVYPLEVIRLAKSVNNFSQLSKAYQKMGMSYVFMNELDSALICLQEANRIAYENNDLENIGSGLRTLGTVYWYKNEIKQAIELYTKSVDIFDQLGDEQQKATSVSNLGTAYYVLGDFSKSIDFYSQALETIDSAKYAFETACYLNDIGTIYKEWGNRSKALEYFLRALKINNLIDNKRYKATNLDNIASIYADDGNHNLALHYMHQGLLIENEINNTYGVAQSFQTISSFHQKNGHIDSALFYLHRALQCYGSIDDKMGLANTYASYGETYLLNKEYHKSIDYFAQARQMSFNIDDEKGVAYALGGLGKAYFFLNQVDSVLSILLQSALLAEEHKYTPLLMSNYKYLAQTYKLKGNRGKEADYLEKLLVVRDTVFHQEKQKQASELLARFESERKEKEIVLLNQKNEIARSQLARQKATLAIILIMLFFTGLGIFLLYRRYREKKRYNKTLENKNREIEEKKQRIEMQNAMLESQAKKLLDLDEIKTRFFTNISHEFRTPLSLIIGPMEQLISKSNDAEVSMSLKRILNNAQNLLGLINQLLEISKIEKGMVKMQLVKGNLCNELQCITHMFTNAALEKNLDLQFRCVGDDFIGFYDKGKLERILFNLLSNALKNTDKGGIRLQLEHAEQKGYVKICVSDTGCGIEREKLPFIFDRFYTTGMASDGRKASSGVGLAYTRELIKMYNGTVDVVSELGKGTTFTLGLPFGLDFFDSSEYDLVDSTEIRIETLKPEIVEPETTTAAQEDVSQKQETVLLVEDHDELRKFIASNLMESYHVLEAENGRVGIEIALKERPHLIITDVMMPEVDGIELAKALKNNETTSHIPIIMLTAKASEESRIAGLETQVDDYLTKPFSYRELSVRIKNLLAIRARLREKFRRAITVSPTEITTNSIDEQFLSKLLRIVEENMADTDFSVETLCDLAGVSRTALHNKLKSLLDHSATEFINSVRMKRAAQFLKSRSGTISEIAWQVGFNNLSYFNRIFRKQFGMTPSEMMEKG